MKKIDLERKLKNVSVDNQHRAIKKAIVDFVLSAERETKGLTDRKDVEGALDIKFYSLDPRVLLPHAYYVASQRVVDKIMGLGNDYVTGKKEVKEISGLKKHKEMRFDVYSLSLKEKYLGEREVHQINLTFVIEGRASDRAKYVIEAEDELASAKMGLDSYDLIF